MLFQNRLCPSMKWLMISFMDGDVSEMKRAGAVSAYHRTGDINELLAPAEGVLLETEDMEVEDEQGGERGNNPETQNIGSLAPAERFVGGTDCPTNLEVKVIVVSALPKDDDMDKVDKELRKVSLDSIKHQVLGTAQMPRNLSCLNLIALRPVRGTF